MDSPLLQAASYLKTLQPGRVPEEIFLQFARLMVISVIELVPLRINTAGEVEVLLLQRPKGDVWSEQWHVPGTLILATDKLDERDDYEQPMQRLLGVGGELAGIAIQGNPIEIETERRKTLRGDELAVIHYVEIAGEPTVGKFFALKDYPHNVPQPGIVPHHNAFVRRAAERFVADKAKTGRT
jgi:hypothetical protein